MSFVKAEYTQQYNRNNYKSISIRFNVRSDADLLKWLQHQGALTDYIRRLIQSDMKRAQRQNRWYIKSSASYEHNNIRQFPYEVLEKLPYNDYYSIGYCETLDDAALMIMNYCEQKGTPDGEIMVLQRSVNKWGNVEGKRLNGN